MLVDLFFFFFFLLKVHRSLINVAQAFACLIVQNNWKQERMFAVCAQNEDIYEPDGLVKVTLMGK